MPGVFRTMPAMATLLIRKMKFDGTEARRIECDLLEVRPDGWHVFHFDARRHRSWKKGQPSTSPAHFICFLSPRQPLVAWFFFDASGERTMIHGDISQPAVVDDSGATFVDLDLDLIVEGDEPAYARDLGDFARNRVSMGYPANVVRDAWSALRQVSEAYAVAAFPFDGTAERTLVMVLARESSK